MRVWKQRQSDGPPTGQRASQGRERQPSVCARSIWMTLYLKNLQIFSLNIAMCSEIVFSLCTNYLIHKKYITSIRCPLPGTLIFNCFMYIKNTEIPKYYARLQTAVARGLGLPASRLAGHHTDASPKHSLCYFSSFFK